MWLTQNDAAAQVRRAPLFREERRAAMFRCRAWGLVVVVGGCWLHRQLLSGPERGCVSDNFLNPQFYFWQASRRLNSSVAVPSAAT